MNALLRRLHQWPPSVPVTPPPEPAPPPPPPKPAATLQPIAADPNALFTLGRTVMTPSIRELVTSGAFNPGYVLARHLRGDWGDLSDGDKKANDIAVRDGERILSAYDLPCGRIYCITDAKDDDGVRQVTTLLLPEEY